MHYWVALLIHSVFLTVLVGIESVKQKIRTTIYETWLPNERQTWDDILNHGHG